MLGGGVFRNATIAFFERIDAGLRERSRRRAVRVLDAPPVVGAALIGLDALGATKAAQRRARAPYA